MPVAWPRAARRFLGADYTGLGSFGTAQDFATGVVNKMDNSYILKLPEWRRAKEPPVQVTGAARRARGWAAMGALLPRGHAPPTSNHTPRLGHPAALM